MKAILLDVYETLLTGPRLPDPEPALRRVLAEFDCHFPADHSLHQSLQKEIRREHARSNDPFPEVDIRKLWQRLLPDLRDPDTFALAAENAIHPVTLLPEAREAIEEFHRQGLLLGIVSNAQAYTRILLAEHLGSAWNHFDPDLLIFSYRHRTAKPGTRLFQLALDHLAQKGVAPRETLMIGDSPKNDLHPAAALGIRTHHFQSWETQKTPPDPDDAF